jgi:acyl-CoA thioesterase FadM
MAFRRTVTVRFDEADARGILFYGRIQELAHRVYEEFVVAELVDSWEQWFLSDVFAVPIRSANAVFHKPMRPGQSYEAELEVARLGEASFEIVTRFRTLDPHRPVTCAETRVVHLFADSALSGKLSIPSALRAKLEQHLARE